MYLENYLVLDTDSLVYLEFDGPVPSYQESESA
jgi:hypothetical protein